MKGVAGPTLAPGPGGPGPGLWGPVAPGSGLDPADEASYVPGTGLSDTLAIRTAGSASGDPVRAR